MSYGLLHLLKLLMFPFKFLEVQKKFMDLYISTKWMFNFWMLHLGQSSLSFFFIFLPSFSFFFVYFYVLYFCVHLRASHL